MIAQTFSDVISVTIKTLQSGQRLDYALSLLLPKYSRSKIKRWIISKRVKVNNKIILVPKKKMKGGELIEINNFNDFNEIVDPQDIPLNIVYEDKDIFVINKTSNMVVHPGVGNCSGTIANVLLYRYPPIIQVTRTGIVQRLDKDTTGLMVVAKNILAYNNLLQLFKERKVIREYEAVVYGTFFCNEGTIDKPICRHPVRRTCMMAHAMGKSAVTHYSVIEKFDICSRVRFRIETGRTHQIRVHMAYIGHPLVGDKKYGTVISCIFKISNNTLRDYLYMFKRQALHACMLQLCHPSTREQMQWKIPLPIDITSLINMLRKN